MTTAAAAAAFSLFPSNLSPHHQQHHHHQVHFLFPLNLHNLRLIQCRSPPLITCPAARRKRVMSDAELCDGLREFLVSVGLPVGRVPSTKELNHHGRKDLANIVRRRGHKVIKELLENSTCREDINQPGLKGNGISEHEGNSIGQEKKAKHVTGLDGDVTKEVSHGHSATIDETNVAASESDRGFAAEELSIDSSVRGKAQKFVKYGQLDEDEGYITSSSKAKQSEGYPASNGRLVDKVSIKHGEEDLQHLSSNSSVNMINGKAWTFEQSSTSAPGKNQIRDSISSANLPTNVIDAKTKTQANQAEIGHLRYQMHQKEQELSLLKEQIQKEKEALSILQTQAENEIGKAEKLISEIDAELQSAEEGLAGLKEVQIQYCGQGEVVEVAGSFNGWHLPIKMDLVQSESRTCWIATLWLYPGVYEIKFVVDGQWKVDPQRESIIRGNYENNILLVER